MKAKLNNSYLSNIYNISSEGQILFIQKWSEMFYHKTIDTYSFKLRNAHTIMLETKEVLIEIKRKTITEINLQDLILECRKHLEKDLCFKKHYPNLLYVLLKELKYKSADKSEILKLDYRLNNTLNFISGTYKNYIIEDLEEAIQRNDFDQIEHLSQLLASELVNSGWSPRSLSRLIQLIFLSQKNSLTFEEKWRKFIEQLNKDIENFRCYFKISDSKMLEADGNLKTAGLNIIRGNEITDVIVNAEVHVQKEAYYLIEEVKSFSEDLHNAAEKSRYQLSIKQSILNYFDIYLENFSKVLVVFPCNKKVVDYELRSEQNLEDNSIQKDIRTVMAVLNKESFLEEDKQRLINFFRQFDLSMQSNSLETKYSNFWSAIESLLVTGHHNSKIEHIKKIVPSILCSNYAYRLLVNFLEDCYRADIKPKYKGESIKLGEKDAIKLLFSLLTEDENDFEDFLLRLKDYTLLKQRCIEIANDLSNSKTLEKLISNHFNTISWNLQRLYRVRNKLVHAAMSEKDTNLLIEHLHFYTVSTVHELIGKLERNEFNSLGDLYLAIEDNYSALTEVLRLNIQSSTKGKYNSYDSDLIFSGPIFGYLL